MFILIFAFIYCSFSSASASIYPTHDICINQLPDINVNDIVTIQTALKTLKNPFTKEEKFEKIKDLLTGEPLFDGGMFQACIYEDYDKGNRAPKILQYMLYKTSKYGLTLLKSISENSDLANYVLFKISKKNELLLDIQKCTKYRLFKEQIQTKEFVLRGCETLYKELQQFSKNGIQHTFTLHDVFSYAFLFAFLHDIAYAKQLDYCSLRYDFIESMYKSFTKQKEVQIQALTFSLLNCYTEGSYGSINFDALQKWHGNKNYYILPILNYKDGLIGLNTLNLCISKQHCPVGFGIKESPAHNGNWTALTDLAFHDLVHGRLPLKLIDNGETPSLGRLYFYKKVSMITSDLIIQYRQSKELNNINLQKEIIKHILSLFFCLHEFSPNPGSFDSMMSQQNSDFVRSNIIDTVKSFIKLQNAYSNNQNTLIDQKALKDILFQALDMIILFQKAYPGLFETLAKHDLKIEKGALISTRNNQTLLSKMLSIFGSLITKKNNHQNQIQYNQLLPVLQHLVWCMSDGWTWFFEKYSIMFNGTMPFRKATRFELDLLRLSIEL